MDLLAAIYQQMNLWQSVNIINLKKSVAPADVATLRKQLKALTSAKVIKDYKECKPSPLADQQTVNKEMRFCLDYQHFNQRTLPDVYSDQNIEKGINCLIGHQFYSVLGLVSGIYQLPNYPGERENPYSLRPLGFYEYERMQPGYCDNLATYQKLMEDHLKDLNMVEVLAHQDYLIVFGKTFEEQMARSDKVFKRLIALGMQVSLQDSSLFFPTVSFAGHRVFESGFSIHESKKDVLTKWPTPRTISELQCYIDFCSYYRQFVKDFQDFAKPLTQLLQDAKDHKAKNPKGPWWTKESIEERWTKECDEAFHRLKNYLVHETTHLPRANMTPPK